jgi:hypothetical protein
MFQVNRKKQKTNPNSLKVSIFGYFSENFGLFRFVTKQFCLFRLFRYRFETPKQTKKFCFWFHETNRNTTETDLVSVCFGSNQNFLFCFENTLVLQLGVAVCWLLIACVGCRSSVDNCRYRLSIKISPLERRCNQLYCRASLLGRRLGLP